jgi:phospholipid/cholesterol/gamma-HCH transport system substrate-binding protein
MKLRVLVAGVAAAILTGCSATLAVLPAPAGVSGPTYHVSADFADVLNLTEGAKVKLQGVVIGEVTAISTRDFRAAVDMDIAEKFPLPVGSTFQIRFATPLGEDFIAVTPPAKPARGMLADGAHVTSSGTSDAPTIEDTFAALSVLLNGGGLDKLQVIARELVTALHGRTGTARDVIARLDTVVAHVDAHRDDIDQALDALASLAKSLNNSSGVIAQALATFPDTLRLVADDTARISGLLHSVGELGRTVRGVVSKSQDALLADLDELRPTLDALAGSRNQLVPMFDSLVRFGNRLDQATPGDYLNLDVTAQLLFDSAPLQPTTAAPSTDSAGAVRTLLGGAGR